MTLKEIQELIKLINKTDLTELKMKDGEFELTIRTNKYEKNRPDPKVQAVPAMPVAPVQQPFIPQAAPVVPAAPAPVAPKAAPAAEAPPAEAKEETGNYLEIKSPIVGTFYRSSSPDKPAYAKVGDTVSSGDVVCIVEAMKLFNEIESEISGKIVKVLVEDAQPVEYDQPLFLVDPKG